MHSRNTKLSSVSAGIVQFIRDECLPLEKGAVVGISGGLDSAVVVSLAVRALGPNKVYGVMMFDPGVRNSQDYIDANALCNRLRIQKIDLNMVQAKEALLDMLHFPMKQNRLLVGNVMARLRMNLLYSFAQWHDALVLGTGDKSEWLMGFFTKHGDGGCDIAPILDVYKTDVRRLALYLQVPKEIALKPSSPNLWEGQTAEGELGFSYESIDAMLKGDELMQPAIQKRFLAAEHKRRLPRHWRNPYV